MPRSNYENFSASFKEVFGSRYRHGTILYQKPNNLKIIYLKDNQPEMEIYLNKEFLNIYLIDLRTVFQQSLTLSDLDLKQAKSDNPFNEKLLSINLNKLRESYDFNFLESKLEVAVLKDNEYRKFHILTKKKVFAYHFSLTPKDITQGYHNMELWINKNGYILRSKTIYRK